MLAVIKLGGVQHLVKVGDIITVNRLENNVNETLVINNVMSLNDGENIKLGSPVLDDASVTAEVLEHSKANKVIIFKKIRRHNHRRKNGFRQSVTKIKITDIKG